MERVVQIKADHNYSGVRIEAEHNEIIPVIDCRRLDLSNLVGAALLRTMSAMTPVDKK